MQTILTAGLTGTFQPSQPFLIVNGLAVVDFSVLVDVAATVEWYFELTSTAPTSPAVEWFREVTEDSPGAGVIEMLPTVRRFSGLAPALHLLDVQAAKAHDFCRIQIRAASGSALVSLSTPFGLPT